jgi:hypothetical protein
MAQSSENWSERRRLMAPRIASVLYGVIAIMTVDLAVQPDRLNYFQAASGALLIGLAMTMTRMFVIVVTKEAEIGAHLPLRKLGTIGRDALLVMLFPVVTVLLIGVTALATARWVILLNLILYFSMAAVFLIGFLSSYVLGRELRPALSRGAAWLLLAVILVTVKKLT